MVSFSGKPEAPPSLECGGWTPLWMGRRVPIQSGVQPPHSKEGGASGLPLNDTTTTRYCGLQYRFRIFAEFQRRRFYKGHALGHIGHQRRRIVLVFNRHKAPIPLPLQLRQDPFHLTLALAQRNIPGLGLAFFDHIFQMQGENPTFELLEALDRIETRATQWPVSQQAPMRLLRRLQTACTVSGFQ